MAGYDDTYINSLVEKDRVHRSVYTDPEIFDLEMERLWGTAWIYIGHDSQVPKSGDYYATTLGTQQVVMTRHKDDSVHVLFNRCAHKGAQVVGDTSGNVRAFRCAYHGWVYDTDGSLLTIPKKEGYEGSSFGEGHPCARMLPVARVDRYRGMVFASMAEQGPDLVTWLGDVATSIDNLADRSPEGELEIAGGCLRYTHDSNWKMFVENLNDAMHPMVVHQSSSGTAQQVFKQMVTEGDQVPAELEILSPFTNNYEFFDKMGLTAFGEYGHSFTGGRFSIHSDYSPIPGYTDKLEANYGKDKTKEIMSVNRHNTVVYPSFTLKGAIQSVRVVRPIAVNKSIIESWVFRLKGAPDELFQRSILYSNLINSPGNLVGPDDYEAYHRVQYGLKNSDNEWVSMHRYPEDDVTDADGFKECVGTSDMVFRHQYNAWKHYLLNGRAA
jgi:benzoate/toluate 1,2-dioxygenase alpha subunit